jgi:hypothetical protein
MESTVVPEITPHTLDVNAEIVNTTTGARTLLPGVTVRLFEQGGSDLADGRLVAEAVSDASGVARLTFDAPVVGQNFVVTGEFNGQVQRIAPLLICNDTSLVFRFESTTLDLLCGATTADSLVFTDDTGSDSLIQNTPIDVGRVGACRSISNRATNGSATIAIPAVVDPFRMEAVYVNGTFVTSAPGTVTIPPGGSLTICFSVPTDKVGSFTQPLRLVTNCGGQTGEINLNLSARVVPPQCRCKEDPLSTVILEVNQRVPVDSSVEESTTLFTNTLSCTVTLGSASVAGTNAVDWTILEPTLPRTVAPGESVRLRVRFQPRSAGESRAELDIPVQPLDGASCTLPVDLLGNGCNNACPEITLSSRNRIIFSPNILIDTLSDRADNRVPVNTTPITDPSVTRTYRISNPDSACGPLTLTIDPTGTDATSARFFRFSPRNLTISPGSSGVFEVEFTAPESDEFRQIVEARQAQHQPPPQVADSAFVLVLRLSGNGCAQTLRIPAVLTPCPGITKIINLRAYNQQTPQKPQPENEVFSFGDLDARVNKGAGGAPGVFPPDVGDIYVDVVDNRPTAVPPQAPILKLTAGSGFEVGLWKRGYRESDFDCGTATEFCPDENVPNYSTNDVTGILPGDVYAFRLSNNVYGLLFVRAVFDGTENNTNHQTALEFRVLFPVSCP